MVQHGLRERTERLRHLRGQCRGAVGGPLQKLLTLTLTGSIRQHRESSCDDEWDSHRAFGHLSHDLDGSQRRGHHDDKDGEREEGAQPHPLFASGREASAAGGRLPVCVVPGVDGAPRKAKTHDHVKEHDHARKHDHGEASEPKRWRRSGRSGDLSTTDRKRLEPTDEMGRMSGCPALWRLGRWLRPASIR